MKLIRETVENVKHLSVINEATGKKNLYIEGTFLVGDKVNKNNRNVSILYMRLLRLTFSATRKVPSI